MPKPKLDELTSDQDWQQADDNVAYDIMARHYPQITQDQFTRIRESIRKKGQADDAILNQVGQSTQKSQSIAGTVMKGYQALSQSMQQGAQQLGTAFDPQPNELGGTPEPGLGQDILRGGAKGLAALAPSSPLEMAMPMAGPLVGRAVAGLPKAVGVATRVGAPAALSAVDALAQNRNPYMAAGMGAAGGALGEALGMGGRTYLKQGPGGVGRMAERAGGRLLDTLEQAVPGSGQLAGRNASEKLFNLGTHEGQRIASNNWKDAGEAADRSIRARGGQLWSGTLSEVYDTVKSRTPVQDRLAQQAFTDMYGHGGSATVDQARNLISRYREIMSKGEGSWATGAKRVAEGARDDVYRQVKQLAGADVADRVQLSDRQYALSKALYGEKGVLAKITNPNGELDLGRLSNELVGNAAKYRKKLGEDMYDQLVQSIMPGAHPGQRATVLAGSNEATNTLRRILAGRGGMGAVAGSTTSLAVPGAANRYPGNDISAGWKQGGLTALGGMLGNKLSKNYSQGQ